ncbi:MAG: tetratricopeptide repeat protein [Planctomycetota bacterium]|jgi:Tfp pilus assembly protein PilF
MKLTAPLLFLLVCSCSTADEATSGSNSKGQLAEARRLMRAQEYDEALTITDGVIEADPRNRAARILAADGNLAIFQTGRSGSAFLLDDAITNLEAALGLQSEDPDNWLRLSQTYYLASRFDKGISSGTMAARQYQQANAPREKVAAAILAVADCEIQEFIALRREEMNSSPAEQIDPSVDVMDSANKALTTLNYVEQAGAEGPANLKAAQVYQWLNRNDLALDALERGMSADPDNSEIHTSYQDLCFSMDRQIECVGAYRDLMIQLEGNTTIQWFLGRAQIARADDARGQGEFEVAQGYYEDARQSYGSFRAKRPEIPGTEHWLAICELSLGAVRFEMADYEGAAKHYDAAFAFTPQVIETDENGFLRIFDSFGGNYVSGIDKIAQAYDGQGGIPGKSKALAFYDRYLELHGKAPLFGPLFNNAGFIARDLGSAIAGEGTLGQPLEAAASMTEEERAKAKAEAMRIWEKSYRYYEVAVELSPEDPRIVNDCGLMLIYHLHRNYDRAEELFRSAIEVGQPLLDELPEDPDPAELEFLEEAVGDAYENIGVLYGILKKPNEEVRPWLEASLKYFPYQRRAAAGRLRRMSGEEPAPRDQREAQRRAALFAESTAAARSKAAEADFDGALLILDGLSEQYKDFAPYHAMVGGYTYAYAEQAREQGQGAALIDGLYFDAERELRRAVELDPLPAAPRMNLADAYLALAKDRESAREASEVIASMGENGDAELLARAHQQCAEAATRAYVNAKQEDRDPSELLDMARRSYAFLDEAGKLSPHQWESWTNLELWAGADVEALTIIERRLLADSSDQALLTQYIDLGKSGNQGRKVIAFVDGSEDPLWVWYQGKARYDQSQADWARGKFDEAIAVLTEARQRFAKASNLNPAFSDTCNQWIAICFGAQGIVEISKDDAAAANKSFMSGPDVLKTPIGAGLTLKQGIMMAGDKFYKADELDKVTEIYRSASRFAPDDVDFANNLGLFARDYARQLRRDNPESSEAKKLFEISYAAYTKASELDPSSLRLRNDRALLLIYYLKRDYPLALDLLQKSLKEGEGILRENPPTDPTALQDLQEAVGDCHQNLGVYYRNVDKDSAAARKALEKSLEFYPFEERASTGYLRRLDSMGADEELSEEDEAAKKDEAAGNQKSGAEPKSSGGK